VAEAKRLAWREKLNKVIAAMSAGDFSPATMAFFLAAGRQEGEAAAKAMIAFRDYQVQQANDSYSAAQSRYHTSVLLFALATVMGLILATVLCYTTIRTLRHQLGGEPSEAAAIATHVGAGDLSVEITLMPGDNTSLMAQLKFMQEHLSQVVTHVRESSTSVATASSQIASGSQDLSNRTERQAGALEETAASMEELNAAVNNNATGAQQANQLAQNASTVAIRGGEVVAQVVDTMKHINDSSKRVFEIISLIDSIAFQTNILALNAAVEAARAGEQGRGFAVVATEVRSLAGRAAEAAKSIKTLISASVTSVEQGCTLVDQAGSTMAEVVSSIRHVTTIMGEISTANTDQSLTMGQVGESVSQIDQITQQNAAMVEEMAAAAGSLGAQAQELSAAMAIFKLRGDQVNRATTRKSSSTARELADSMPLAPSRLPLAA
jgi:methyl-accepting chemotaxis protein